MKNNKLFHTINKIFYFTTLILYLTFYLGILFQIVLGIVQVIIGILLTISMKKLNSSTKKRLLYYWILVSASAIILVINYSYEKDLGYLFSVFIFPMLIASYFYYLTANIDNDSFLKANWTNLALINYEVDARILENYIPKGTELELWNGKCYISLVGFMFENVKLLGFKIPYHVNFEEMNLRFYVKRFEDGKWKRGVVFIKELVPKPALTFVANTVYKEHYQTLPMKHSVSQNINSNVYVYQWKTNDKWNSILIETEKIETDIALNSGAEFITEHYFGYTKITDSKTFEYEVKHPRWQQLKVINHKIDIDFKATYGPEFDFLKNSKPTSILFTKGSEISVENKIQIK